MSFRHSGIPTNYHFGDSWWFAAIFVTNQEQCDWGFPQRQQGYRVCGPWLVWCCIYIDVHNWDSMVITSCLFIMLIPLCIVQRNVWVYVYLTQTLRINNYRNLQFLCIMHQQSIALVRSFMLRSDKISVRLVVHHSLDYCWQCILHYTWGWPLPDI